MSFNRRDILAAGSAALAAGLTVGSKAQAQKAGGERTRIAVEEAFSTKDHMRAMGDHVTAHPEVDRFDYDLWRMITSGDSLGDTPKKLLDFEGERLRLMDEHGVTMQVLSLTSPGVQMLEPDVAVGIAESTNDQLRDVIARHPGRFAGLATVAPQVPEKAAKEVERAITKLGLNGVVINSHTNNEYLDDRKYWPILEAAEALNAPIYIHPRAPADQMAGAFNKYNMGSAFWGYGMETSTHFVRLMMSGAFDRFPNLKVVLGHMGEAVHFWIWRLDYMSAPGIERGETPVENLPSHYLRRNLRITTSGQQYVPALKYSIEVLGLENVMWAIDYPYQEVAPAVAFMNDAPVSESEREALFHLNAKRTFNLSI